MKNPTESELFQLSEQAKRLSSRLPEFSYDGDGRLSLRSRILFESYVEDVDISIRARLYGYTSYYCADAIIYHYGSATSGSKYNSFKVRISARNNVYLLYIYLSFLLVFL